MEQQAIMARFLKDKSELKGVSSASRSSIGSSSQKQNSSPFGTSPLQETEENLTLYTPRLCGASESPPGTYDSPVPRFMETSPFYKNSQTSFGKNYPANQSERSENEDTSSPKHNEEENFMERDDDHSSTIMEELSSNTGDHSAPAVDKNKDEEVSQSATNKKNSSLREEEMTQNFPLTSPKNGFYREIRPPMSSPPPNYLEEQTIIVDTSSSQNLSGTQHLSSSNSKQNQPSNISNMSKNQGGHLVTRDSSNSDNQIKEESLSLEGGHRKWEKQREELKIEELRGKEGKEESEISFSEMLDQEKEETNQFLMSFKGDHSKQTDKSQAFEMTYYQGSQGKEQKILEERKSVEGPVEKRFKEGRMKVLKRALGQISNVFLETETQIKQECFKMIFIRAEAIKFAEEFGHVFEKSQKRKAFFKIYKAYLSFAEIQEKIENMTSCLKSLSKRITLYGLVSYKEMAKQKEKAEFAMNLVEKIERIVQKTRQNVIWRLSAISNYIMEKEAQKIKAFRLRRACARLQEHSRLQGIKRYIKDYYKSVILRAMRKACIQEKQRKQSLADKFRIKCIYSKIMQSFLKRIQSTKEKKDKSNQAKVLLRKKLLKKGFNVLKGKNELEALNFEEFGEYVPIMVSYREELSFSEGQSNEEGWEITNKKYFSMKIDV